MEIYNLNDMIRGWFIGNFSPSAIRTSNFEVGVKRYLAGEREARHVHKVSTELTLVVEGDIQIGGTTLHSNEMIILHPEEPSEFIALTDSTLVVVKVPSVSGDKYVC